LGDLPRGAVDEIRTRTLREQLGERLAREAGCDFAAPLREPEPKSPPLLRGRSRKAR
jgi:23S rRNA pseudouridine2605 synthase